MIKKSMKLQLAEVLDAAITISDADFGNIQLLDKRSGHLRIVAQKGFPDWWINYFDSVEPGQAACGVALVSGERVIVDDVETDPIFAGKPSLDPMLKVLVRAVQSTPIIDGAGKFLGMFSTHYRTYKKHDLRELRMLDMIAGRAAEIIQRVNNEIEFEQLNNKHQYLIKLSDMMQNSVLLGNPLRDYMEVLKNYLNVDQVGYFAVNEDEDYLELVEYCGNNLNLYHQRHAKSSLAYFETCLVSRNPIVINDFNDLSIDSYERAISNSCNFRSHISIPIYRGDKLVALLSVTNIIQRDWTDHDINAVVETAERIWVDIQRRSAEEELRRNEERFRSFFNNANVGFAQIDTNLRFTNINQKFCDITGYDRSELIGIRGPLDLDHPDDKIKDHSPISQALNHGANYFSEKRYIHKNGHIIWVRVNAAGIRNLDGVIYETIAIIEDITDSKISENKVREFDERLKSLVDGVPVGLGIFDRNGKFIHANNQLKKFLPNDLINSNEAEQKKYWTGYAKDGRPLLQRDFPRARALRGEFVVPGVEMKYTADDGRISWCVIQAVPFRDLNGDITGGFGTLIDITEQKEAQASRALAQRLEALGQLTGGIAHDFNNLLTVVSGNLELAESLISDEKTLKYLRKSMAAVDAGASINKRLLSFAMQRKLKPKCMYLNERIIDIFKLLQRTLGEQVQIEHELDPNAWPTVADAGEIDSAIINIALNSRDAMPRGGKISIKLSNVSINKKRAIELNGQDGDYVCLSIRDTGEGMAAEVLSRCMDPFFTTKDTGKGVGLGLSSVYGLTRQLGGFINISSFMGKGTTVSIYLKRAQSIDKYNWSSGHVGSIVPGNGEQILIVEDQDDIRDITAERLKVLGYSVIVAKSGAEAIHILESSIHIDLVFSDVIMPGEVSGYDILAWIRNNRPEMHVLLTSGYEPSQEIGHLDMKCVRTLNKPYTQSQISTEIYRALNEVTRN